MCSKSFFTTLSIGFGSSVSVGPFAKVKAFTLKLLSNVLTGELFFTRTGLVDFRPLLFLVVCPFYKSKGEGHKFFSLVTCTAFIV